MKNRWIGEGSGSLVHEKAQRAVAGVDEGDVQQAVAVEVAHGQPLRTPPHGVDRLRGKAAIAVVEQHAHRGVAEVRDDEIRKPVAVEVTGAQRPGIRPDLVRSFGCEAAVALVQQHAHRVVAVVRGGKVRLAIAVEVGHRHRVRDVSHRERGRRAEAPAPAAPEYPDVVRIVGGDQQVELPIPVEVPDRHRSGLGSRVVHSHSPEGVGHLGGKAAVAQAQQEAHRVVPAVAHGEIELAIAVEIACHDRWGQGAHGVGDLGGEALRTRERARPARRTPGRTARQSIAARARRAAAARTADSAAARAATRGRPAARAPTRRLASAQAAAARARSPIRWSDTTEAVAAELALRAVGVRGAGVGPRGRVGHGERAAGQSHAHRREAGAAPHQVKTAAVPVPKATAPAALAIHIQFWAAGSSLAAVA